LLRHDGKEFTTSGTIAPSDGASAAEADPVSVDESHNLKSGCSLSSHPAGLASGETRLSDIAFPDNA
jgi:hypothetical protein